ncbi:hypothetical protein EON65_43585, partial [archaeon]
EVTAVGQGVRRLAVGDWVLPATAPFGTWRQRAVATEDSFLKVRNDIPAEYAGTMSVNMGTAHRLLEDFQSLQPGDWIVQNGANSMVGLAVIQMARERGIHTINVVRGDGPDTDVKLRLLASMGGDINVPDSYLDTHQFRSLLKEVGSIKLGFNCVGGTSALHTARVLGRGGVLVSYGGMAKQPLSLPADFVAEKASAFATVYDCMRMYFMCIDIVSV